MNTHPLRPHVNFIQDFFETLYGQAEDGKLVLSWPSITRFRPDGIPGLDSDWLDLTKASWPDIARAASRRAYFGVVLQHPAAVQVGAARGRNATAYLAPGLWMDVDIASGAHKQAGPLPLSIHEVLAFLHSLPCYPSIIVNTIGGVHAHWLFREPFVMPNEGDRAEFAHLSKRFAATVADKAKSEYGWQLDRVGDLARVLRAPGTVTHKYNRHVALLDQNTTRYNPVQDFDDWLDALPLPVNPSSPGIRLGGQLDIQVVAAYYNADLKKKSSTELSGSHPQHGSSTGRNFNLNPAKGLWHCWRCGSGGDAFQLIAVCEEMLACKDAGMGALKGDLFRRVARIAKDKFGVEPPLRTTSWVPPLATINAQEVPSCL
jgi:CHC2 zinc finger